MKVSLQSVLEEMVQIFPLWCYYSYGRFNANAKELRA